MVRFLHKQRRDIPLLNITDYSVLVECYDSAQELSPVRFSLAKITSVYRGLQLCAAVAIFPHILSNGAWIEYKARSILKVLTSNTLPSIGLFEVNSVILA